MQVSRSECWMLKRSEYGDAVAQRCYQNAQVCCIRRDIVHARFSPLLVYVLFLFERCAWKLHLSGRAKRIWFETTLFMRMIVFCQCKTRAYCATRHIGNVVCVHLMPHTRAVQGVAISWFCMMLAMYLSLSAGALLVRLLISQSALWLFIVAPVNEIFLQGNVVVDYVSLSVRLCPLPHWVSISALFRNIIHMWPSWFTAMPKWLGSWRHNHWCVPRATIPGVGALMFYSWFVLVSCMPQGPCRPLVQTADIEEMGKSKYMEMVVVFLFGLIWICTDSWL